MRAVAIAAALLLAACNAPDYTPVRDWARSASIATDYPVAAPADDGAIAMQAALVTWLSALGRMADDGVLPYPEDPFLELAPRAAATDAAGGAAVAALGRRLRHATRNNLRAPALRNTIRGADPDVQALVVALSGAVTRAGPPGRRRCSASAPPRTSCAAPRARCRCPARQCPHRQRREARRDRACRRAALGGPGRRAGQRRG